MNKKILKLLFLILIIFLINLKLDVYAIDEYVNKETGYKVLIEDDAKLLNDLEIKQLQKELISLTEYGNIAFKTVNQNLISTASYASKYYYQKFDDENGTIFLIDLGQREIYIFSTDQNYKIITKSKARIITDNIYSLASKEKYYECASKGFKQINSLLKGEKIIEPMRYISNIYLSLMISFSFIYLIIFLNIKNKKMNKVNDIEKELIKFNVGDINYRKIREIKEFSPSSFMNDECSDYNGYEDDKNDDETYNSSNNINSTTYNSSSSSKNSGVKYSSRRGGGGHRF